VAIPKVEEAKMVAKTRKKASKPLHRGKKLGAVKPLKKGAPQEYLQVGMTEVYISNG
jgi:hypothetical protein